MPTILSRRQEEILQTVHVYRFMTTLDIATRLFSPSSEAYVRKLLSPLCGGADGARDQYLYRFELPHVGPGQSVKVFTLGSRGRDFLSQEVGLPCLWYFRPQKVKNASYGTLLHNLILTRFLVAAERFARHSTRFTLSEIRTCYEIAQSLPTREGAHVVPDAWLLFEGREGEAPPYTSPVLLEIDRGTEFKQRFQDHIRSRVEFVSSGAYAETFGTKVVTIAYVTAGHTLASGQVRRRSMCEWTLDVLKEQGREAWAANFRFTSVVYDALYQLPLFVSPMWYRPDREAPVGLFS